MKIRSHHSALRTSLRLSTFLLLVGALAAFVLTAPQPASAYEPSMNVAINGTITINEGESYSYGISISEPPTAKLTFTPRSDSSLLRVDTASVSWEAQSVLSTDWMQYRSVTVTAVDDEVCRHEKGAGVDTIFVTNHATGGGDGWNWDISNVEGRHHGYVLRFNILDDDCNEVNPVLVASTRYLHLDEGQTGTYTVTVTERVTGSVGVSVIETPLGNERPQWRHRQQATRDAVQVTTHGGGSHTAGAVLTYTVTAPVRSNNANDHAMRITHRIDAPTQSEITGWEGAAVIVTVRNRNPNDPTFYSADPEPQKQVAEYEPGMVGDLQATTTPTTATVSWSAPERGGEARNYIAHIRPVGGEGKGKTTKRPDAPKTHTTFKNLTPGATYKLWVRAQNDAGKGLRRHVTITLPTEAEYQAEQPEPEQQQPPPEPTATPTPEPTATPTPEPEEPEQQQQAVVTCDGTLTIQDVVKANTDAASGAITLEQRLAIIKCWDKQRGH